MTEMSGFLLYKWNTIEQFSLSAAIAPAASVLALDRRPEPPSGAASMGLAAASSGIPGWSSGCTTGTNG
jgi:hypothetical protein